MDQRRRFVEDWLEGDFSMVALCGAFGISRKTGYKWLARFHETGLRDLDDRSRARHAQGNAAPEAVVREIIKLRQRHPFWGPRKLKVRLERLQPQLRWPASSTIGCILKRRGLVRPRTARRRTPLYQGPFAEGLAPNEVWAADFKGWFKTADGTRIDPLTVTDCASRYLIRCRAVAQTNGDNVRAQLTAAFQEFGMPQALRTDNGVPFATVGLGGLSELSVWLIRLGIRPERIRPAKPQDNGAHERMHRTLKQETANPPGSNPSSQQQSFDRFQAEYNDERPHEYLEMKTPADVYSPSSRPFPQKLPELQYPAGSTIRLVTTNGTINFRDKRIYLTRALINENVRLEETEENWTAWYGPIQLGTLDLEREEIRPTKVLPMCPV